MENTNKRLDSRVNAVANINHLSGLIQEIPAFMSDPTHLCLLDTLLTCLML